MALVTHDEIAFGHLKSLYKSMHQHLTYITPTIPTNHTVGNIPIDSYYSPIYMLFLDPDTNSRSQSGGHMSPINL